jgi:hypothetical protein
VPRVAHIQPKNIRARHQEIADSGVRVRSWSEGADDFRFSHGPMNDPAPRMASLDLHSL